MATSSCGGEVLFRRGNAELSIVGEGEERLLMQRGDFVLSLVKHACSPLAAVVAVVGDLHWPVGKDSLVVKTKGYRYSFSLPAALTFALAFNSPQAAHLQQLDCLLRQYSTFMPLLGAGTVETANAPSAFWTRYARNADGEDSAMHEMHQDSGGSFCDKDLESVSPRLAQKVQQARRMSAVEKLFARSVERGAINAAIHVTMGEADASRADSQAGVKLVVASVDAVAKVVEAVETAGKTLCVNTQTAMTDWIQKSYGKERGKRAVEGLDVCGNLISSAWTLNKIGMRMLLGTIARIQSRRNTSSMSDGSRSSSGSEVSSGLQIPSSGSLHSTSSRLPSTIAHSPVAADNPPSTSQMEALCSSTLAADTVPQAHAGATSLSLMDTSLGLHGGRISSAVQRREMQPFPLLPRWCGTGLPPPRSTGVPHATVSLAAARGDAVPSVMGWYRAQPLQQANARAQTSTLNSPPPPPFRFGPASRPHHDQQPM